MTTWLFGNSARANAPTPPASALRVQSALQGTPIAILVAGQNRLAGNVIEYVDFRAIAAQQSSTGGKGGVAGGGKGAGTGGSYLYQVAVAVALCEGPISQIVSVWNNKSQVTLASLNGTSFLGDYSQAAWGYLSSLHPDRALTYRGLAYVAFGPLQLGETPELPNFSFELLATDNTAIASAPDGDPADCITSLLSNQYYGVGFPGARIGDLTIYSNYCRALGLVMSPALTQQQAANEIAADWLKATNSEAVWSGGLLKIIPYGDENVSGNGASYTAPSAPEYDLTDDDFLGPDDEDNVLCHRKRPADRNNVITIEILDRSNSYNPLTIDAKNDAEITLFGERIADGFQAHFFCLPAAGQMSASLMLGREQIANTFEFSLSPKYALLEPMDIVTITVPRLGLNRQWVRIKEITRNSDRSRKFLAEEYLTGTGAAPQYGRQAGAGALPNYNVSPGVLNTPLLFEPTDELAGGLEVWGAISGVDIANYGGCDVYVSTDGEEYSKLPDRLMGPARMGVLTATLNTITANPIGRTVDETNTLSVDLSESGSELTSGSQADVLALNTILYVGGELIAYRDATVTGANAYDLTYLIRGAYGTEDEIAAHAAGSQFARLDRGIFRYPFDQSRIGSTIYLKFVPFNIYGAGQPSIADVAPYTYVIRGTALASPLPDVTNLRTVFVDGFTNLDWTEIEDFRPVRYEIRLGASVDGALTIGTVAHPPFVIPGNGTYWVAAVSQPIAGLTVYSEDWATVTVSGAALVRNVVVTWDEKTTGWTGTFANGAGVSGTAIRTGGSGNILTDPNIIANPNILDYGGEQNGSYAIPAGHRVNVGYVAPCAISVKYLPTGVPVGQDILTVPDILSSPDILGSASARFVDVRPQIRFATDNVPTWGAWQDFTPGVYLGQWFDFQLLLETIDPQTICFCLEFSFSVDVPDRVDANAMVGGVLTSLTNLLLDAAGTTISFVANTGSAAQAFNGGPGGTSVPNIQVTIRNAQAGDDVIVSGVTKSQATIQVKNGGVGVARNVDIRPQGY